jgi:putative ABC transport system permease protein
MLGILIGIASVMLTVGLGQGAQKSITDEINKLGSNMLMVTAGSNSGFAAGPQRTSRVVAPLTLSDAAALANTQANPDILEVAPVSQTTGTVAVGDTSLTTTVVGTTSGWAPIRARNLDKGRFFTADESRRTRVAVIGSDRQQPLRRRLPGGPAFTMNRRSFTVIGVWRSSSRSPAAGHQVVARPAPTRSGSPPPPTWPTCR